jgi:epoxyqueuosine reductase
MSLTPQDPTRSRRRRKQMKESRHQDPAAWITALLRNYIDRSPENHLNDPDRETACDSPLVGFAAGDDPLFEAYKKHVGPFHWTPLEAFQQAFPEQAIDPAEISVISWILPQTQATKADNRQEKRWPAERWSRARTFGEVVNEKLRRHLVEALRQPGINAVAPVLAPNWERRWSDRHGFASTWSERHAAHACGLGTFGLSDGLITPLGKAVRVGSVVARMRFDPSPRPYTDHHAYCLFFSKGLCGKCIERCPAGAISETGHDKVKCKAYIRQEAMPYIRAHYGFAGKGCGLCQTGVPCESRIPTAAELRTVCSQATT